ncbi:MAG: hypothetical protein HY735_26970 [Verrucomicrobia bacterium]|nr:hypothetical protein [Verrucomicrobiota bacterium]
MTRILGRTFFNASSISSDYDFAVKRLDPFLDMNRSSFDQVSLHLQGQQIILGAILKPSYGNVAEYGIQLVGLDPYPKETVATLFELVKSTVVAGPTGQAYYIPSFEQAASAQAGRAFYESKGIPLSGADRWIQGNQTYSAGWAMGRLKLVPAAEIATAFSQGRLSPEDILLTDAIPAEIPVLAGVISLAASTPNSHVAILARSFGIPFVHLADPSDREQAQKLVNREIVLRAGEPDDGGKVDLIAVDAAFDPALKAEILALKNPPPLQVPRKQRYGALTASTDNLVPSDIKFFGGKAANFGLLRRSIPANSPVAIAFSTDLWDDFMDQTLPNGRSLRAEIKDRLAGNAFPPNMPALTQSLSAVRKLITDTARFSPAGP